MITSGVKDFMQPKGDDSIADRERDAVEKSDPGYAAGAVIDGKRLRMTGPPHRRHHVPLGFKAEREPQQPGEAGFFCRPPGLFGR